MADKNIINLSETNGTSLVSTAAVFLILTWTSVLLRTYTRAVIMKGLQLDDWIMLFAEAIFTVYCGFLFAGVERGIGTHNDAITDDAVKVDALKWQSLAIATYIFLMMVIKLSIGVFLLRLAAQKIYIWILRVSIVVITIWSLGIFFWNIFQCNPVDKQWDYRLTTGHCVSSEEIVSAAYAMTALTVLSDWLYALLPIPMLWRVKMSMQAKITVIMILSLGIFASVATLVRIRFLPDMANLDDILYAGTNAMIWTIVEAGLAIVASSLATIRPLLRAMRVRGFESTENNTGQSKQSKRSLQQNSATAAPQGATYSMDDLPGSPGGNGTNEPKRPYIVKTRDLSAMEETTAMMTAVSNGGADGGGRPLMQESDRSEVYVIQGQPGTFTSSAYSGMSNASSDDIHDLEAQSQEHPRFGIGAPDSDR